MKNQNERCQLRGPSIDFQSRIPHLKIETSKLEWICVVTINFWVRQEDHVNKRWNLLVLMISHTLFIDSVLNVRGFLTLCVWPDKWWSTCRTQDFFVMGKAVKSVFRSILIEFWWASFIPDGSIKIQIQSWPLVALSFHSFALSP